MSAGEVPPSTLFYMAMSTTLFMLGAGFAKMASLPPQEADTDNEVDCIDNEPTTVYDIDSEVEAAEVKECRSTGAGFANSAGIGKPSAAGVHRSKSAAHAFEVGISAKPRVSVPGVQTMRRDQQGECELLECAIFQLGVSSEERDKHYGEFGNQSECSGLVEDMCFLRPRTTTTQDSFFLCFLCRQLRPSLQPASPAEHHTRLHGPSPQSGRARRAHQHRRSLLAAPPRRGG